MSRTLVELKLTDIPESVRSSAYMSYEDYQAGVQYQTEYLNNIIVNSHHRVSCYESESGEVIGNLLDEGFVKGRQDLFSGDIIYTKREHFSFSDETKKIIDKLFTEERQDLERCINKAKNNAKRSNDALEELEDRIDKATFVQRLKYLFGGDL